MDVSPWVVFWLIVGWGMFLWFLARGFGAVVDIVVGALTQRNHTLTVVVEQQKQSSNSWLERIDN